MARFRSWLIGKKTYLVAGVLLLVTVVLLGTGKLTPQNGIALVLFAACAFPVTFRASLAAHQKQMLEIAEEVAETGAAIAAHNYTVARAQAYAAVQGAATLAPEIRAEINAPAIAALVDQDGGKS